MKLIDAYLDILKRAGDGYSDYIDRARELFWRALGSLILQGEITAHEVASISHRYSIQIGAHDFPYLLPHYNDSYHVFTYTVAIDSVTPNVVFTEVDNNIFLKSSTLLGLSKRSGLLEVLWTNKYPTIEAAYDTANATVDKARASINVHLYGVPVMAITSANDQSETSSYIAYSLLTRVIEAAVAAIIQEIRG